jgi:hypothetical protein
MRVHNWKGYSGKHVHGDTIDEIKKLAGESRYQLIKLPVEK